ncbi:hypothetical protein [Pedobacter nyackensis]|uniref:Outer membrane protein beta-barrel domain-containing protein n=1 Tax=Pedobacter nyackensis TaxID=475255 RepID=A0A1W2BMF2_9SPHI|nr:hypothetical protein [Pedobacter nyackensis]SMC74024.1 hypothetical protein SAMN04488101_102619 [Pedobacter nyackensis]
MKPVDDELFAHIKESLTEHEEAYVPGAWEHFEKKESKRIGWYWLAGLSSAAAVLLIGFALFYSANNTPDHRIVLEGKVKPIKQNVNRLPDTPSAVINPGAATQNLETEVAENEAVVAQRENNQVHNNPLIVTVKQPDPIKHDAIVSNVQPVISPRQINASNPVVRADQNGVKQSVNDSIALAKVEIKEKPVVEDNKPRSFQEFLDAEVKANKGTLAATKSTTKKIDKWDMGVVVAPSIDNSKKLNMGYGFSLDYALSSKVSISSGVSYNEMGASKSAISNANSAPNSPAAPSAMVTETKSLQSVEASLVGIDIPLGIKYNLSKKLYTNVGVSAFAILNQTQQHNYLRGTVEYVPSTMTNVAGFKAVFMEKKVSEPVPVEEIRDDKYLGFYNLSFGYKQSISGNKAFSVEPFMKLPMKSFTKENLHLMGTGVRLKFDF